MQIHTIALITGVQDEADIFLPDALQTMSQTPFGHMRSGQYAQKNISILCSGIGKVNASAAATWLVTQTDAQLLMIIGTAGKISTIAGDCFYLHEALQSDYVADQDSGFIHYNAGSYPIGPSNWAPFNSLPQPAGLNLPQARISTADAFIENANRSAYLRDILKADLVDMETAAVAQVAARLGIAWAAIKAPTDDANGDSAGDFESNLAEAAKRAADAACQFVQLV